MVLHEPVLNYVFKAKNANYSEKRLVGNGKPFVLFTAERA